VFNERSAWILKRVELRMDEAEKNSNEELNILSFSKLCPSLTDWGSHILPSFANTNKIQNFFDPVLCLLCSVTTAMPRHNDVWLSSDQKSFSEISTCQQLILENKFNFIVRCIL
jgi:hypothetical protein